MHSDISVGAAEYWEPHQVWLVYFQVWTGWPLKTEPDLVSSLHLAPLLPCAWQHSAEPAFSLLGMQTFCSSEAQSTLEALDVSVSVN